MRFWLLILALWLFPLVAAAQDPASSADRSFLTAFLEDNLSGLGRSVRITGFAGALSSRATFAELTIADAEGVWLTIRDGAISWNRGALLSGRVEIAEMSAAEIDLPRRPSAGKASVEASGFSLPDLPVGVSIDQISAGRVRIGAELFGAEAEVSLTGSMRLEGGEGTADLAIERIDGRKGRLSLTSAYANATRKATLDLFLSEAPDGIAANLLALPGAPSVELAVHGTGIIDDFRTDIALSTDGQPRLTGFVTLISAATGGKMPERRFTAALGGDITPLLLPEYRDFVGSKVTLQAEGARAGDGGLDLKRFVLSSQGLDISGRLVLTPEGLPLQAALTTRLGLAGGGEVLLPIPGEKTHLRSAELTLRYDATRGDGWRLAGVMGGLRRGEVQIGRLTLDGSGRIARAGVKGIAKAGIGGTVTFSADRIDIANPALAEAIGPELKGKAIFIGQEGEHLRVADFSVKGSGYSAAGGGAISGPDQGLTLTGRIAMDVGDMGRFSGLAGRPLGGAATLAVSGTAEIISGYLDLEGHVTGQNLAVSHPEVDSLLRGLARIDASLLRDANGIAIRALELRAATLSAQISGQLRSGSSDLLAVLNIGDLAAFGPKYRGTMKAKATLKEAGTDRKITVAATARDLAIGQASADLLLAGTTDLDLSARENGGKVRLDAFSLTNPQLLIEGSGTITDATRRLDLSARLHDMALLAPGFPGPLTLAGAVTETPETGYRLDLTGQGPGATTAQINGTLATDFSSADLTFEGGAQSAIVNSFIAPRNISGPVQFDLRLAGKPGLAALSGRISAEGARLVAPVFGIDMQNARILADLADGRAQVSAAADVRGGGSVAVSGPISLSAPFPGDLTVELAAVRLRDPDLYDTTVSGRVTISGPMRGGALISGAVSLDKTEISIPSTGFGIRGAIGSIDHINEPALVRQTRVRAGLVSKTSEEKKRGPPFALDLSISAPGRIFVRGRGLDAELGGSLRIEGTTENMVPSGQFTLIRGRLDILGKRLTIDQGLVQLQGAMVPFIQFAASTQSDGITSTVLIDGNASEPEIRFLSVPELPEKEVIAHLLFGRGLTSLSAFQAAQLASAVAALSGRGGEGIVAKLRNSFGLDDLDVITDQGGTAAVKVGKYLTEKVYTDVTIGSDGKSEINLNLDIRRDLTVRGTMGSEGATGIGIYYEKDY